MFVPDVNVATGFYTNWDSFVKVDEKILGWVKNQPKTPPKPGVVLLESMEEVAYTLDEAFRKGGGEFLISKKVYDKLNSIFSFSERRIGGNGFNMGKALHELGLTPLVSFPCRPLKIMINSPRVKVACKDGLKLPNQAIRIEDPEYDHLIFEFKENPKKGVYISGRHILSWDLMSFYGKFDEEFFDYAFNKKYTDILIFAYAHLLLPVYKEKTKEIADRLEEGRKPKVHFEFGQGSMESLKYAIKIFSDKQCTDSWGLNEKECVQYFGAESENLEDLKNSTLEAAKKYGLDRICVHTSKFVFSISKIEPKKEIEALVKGCIVATSASMGGISENLVKAQKLSTYNIQSKIERFEGYNFCLVPAYKNPNPKILTGLGDSFAAIQALIALA